MRAGKITGKIVIIPGNRAAPTIYRTALAQQSGQADFFVLCVCARTSVLVEISIPVCNAHGFGHSCVASAVTKVAVICSSNCTTHVGYVTSRRESRGS